MPAECPAGGAAHNPADSRGEGPPKAARSHRPCGAGRHRPKGRPRVAHSAEWLTAGRSLIIEGMSPSAESPQPAALREELSPDLEIAQLTAALEALRDDRQRAECMAAIQTRCGAAGARPARHASRPARLLPRVHQAAGGRLRSACLRRVAARRGQRHHRPVDGEHRRRNADGGQRRLGVAGAAAREHEPALIACEEGHTEIVEYDGDDQRLPEAVREFNRTAAVKSLLVAPLHLSAEDARMDRLVERRGFRVRAALAARVDRRHCEAGDARALLQPSRRSQPARGASPGGARRAQSHRPRHPRHAGAGVRRDPHAAAGGAAGRRCESAAGAGAQPRDRRRSGAHASRRGAPVGRRAAAAVRRARRRRPRRWSAWSTSCAGPAMFPWSW